MDQTIVVIVGPTASGKTGLAIALARAIGGEIISADSRQVYRGMDVGTGKDLDAYGDVPYHLIDIADAGEKYHVAQFQQDFAEVIGRIKDKRLILCGGSGLYIQSVLQGFQNTQIPLNPALRSKLEGLSDEALDTMLNGVQHNTRKRKIRALEIAAFLKGQHDFAPTPSPVFRVFGLDPPLELRRKQISDRLKVRIQQEGLLAEVEGLIAQGVSIETLEYYGLEYKYIARFLTGFLRYDEMYSKLETEIHRYAKRQMTFFRSMEKKGIPIDWVPYGLSLGEKVAYILGKGI